jgi:hypothetical protein
MSQNEFARPSLNDRLFTLVLAILPLFYSFALTGPLSYDEYFALYHIEGLSYGDILFPLTGLSEPHPPFYYFLMKCLFGPGILPLSPFWLRLPSLIFSSGYLIVMFHTLKDRMDSKTLKFALVLIILTAFFATYAREARMYALNLFLLSVSLWGISSFETSGNQFYRWTGRICGCLAGMTHFSSLLYLPFIYLWYFFQGGRKDFKGLGLNLLTLVPGSLYFLLKAVVRAELFSYHLSWIPSPGYRSLRKIFLDFFIHNDYSYHLPVPEILVTLFILGNLCLLAWGFLKAIQLKKTFLTFLFSLSVFPFPVALIYFFLTGISVIYPRGFALSLILFFILWVWVLGNFGKRLPLVLGLCLGAFLLMNQLLWNPYFLHRKESSPHDLGVILGSHPGPKHMVTCSRLKGFYEYLLTRESGEKQQLAGSWEGRPDEIWLLESWCQDDRVSDLRAHYEETIFSTSSFGVRLLRFKKKR